MHFATRVLCVVITGIFSFGNDPVLANIRGTPEIDYPSYSSIPRTSFKCSDQDHATGFYADPETRCQVFHYCYANRQETFLCPIGTTFNQAINSCDYWYSSECDSTGELYTAQEVPNNGLNDKSFTSVSSSPHNVFEKMIALRDSNGNLYKQDDLTAIESGETQESFSENNPSNYKDSDRLKELPISLSNLEEIPLTDERNLNFAPYDHETVDIDDIEIVVSKDEQLKVLHNNPDFDYVEENSYSQEDFNLNDEDKFSLEPDEILLRMYQKGQSSGKQVKEMLNIDPNSPNQDVSNFGLNSDAMLHKRFSEVESKKRRIRRKPKYVILQTNFVDNSESQKSDLEHETAASSKNNLVITYESDSNTIDSKENAVNALQLENGKSKRNRKPLRKASYSTGTEIPVTDRQVSYSENSKYQMDQKKSKDTSDEIVMFSDVIKQTSVPSPEDLYGFENTNVNRDEEYDNSDVHIGNLDSNNIFTLNEVKHLNLKEPMEDEESHLDLDTRSSDGINELLLSNGENNYQFREFFDSGERDFIQEHAEESSGIGNSFSDFGNGATSLELLGSNELSDSYSSSSKITGSEALNSLGHNSVVDDETEENQNGQTYLESAKEEPTSKDITNSGNNAYLESVNDIDNENKIFENENIEIERAENLNPGVRVNSKYLSFEEADLEPSGLNEVDDEDRISSKDEQKTQNVKNSHTEMSVDSLEYFESEGQGYFIYEYGRVYILSVENGESETLIYVGEIDSEGNLGVDIQDIYLSKAENSLQESVQEDSYFPEKSEDPVEDHFNSIDSTENEFGKTSTESQDIKQLPEDNVESVLGDDDAQPLAEYLNPQKKFSDFANFSETESLAEGNGAIIQVLEETDVQSNLNQTNATSDYPIDTSTHFFEDEYLLRLERVKNPQINNNEMNVFETPEAKREEMSQDLDKLKDSKFHLSSIPLPANDYEKSLYDEKMKNALQDSNTIISDVFRGTFYKDLQEVPVINRDNLGDYKELQAVPVINRNNPVNSKTDGRSSQTAELLNIKTRLFGNIKSDLASDEVKSAVAEVGSPSKIIDNIFSSFSSPFQSMQGNVPGYFPLHTPKFRNVPNFSTRTGKKFKPSNIFKLINFGKKLLKLKRIKLNTLKEYFDS